eukprot:jgi/Botrbrau1/9828/Bobra.0313s0007.1
MKRSWTSCSMETTLWRCGKELPTTALIIGPLGFQPSSQPNLGSYVTDVFGIAGDTTGNLMWRLQHGELPKGVYVKAVVLLTGSNDLSYADSMADGMITQICNVTLEHTLEILEALKEAAPNALLVAVALLPRGDPQLHPHPQMYSLPSKFSKAVSIINEGVSDAIEGTGIRQLDCGSFFLTPGGSALDPELMPDAVHPSIKGMRLLTQCIHGAVRQALSP